ncbi:hypothetical protein LTR10_017153 [Elasticomyces elasticus]|uniref:glycerophosphodiester phosphodiesterase n=1 Tax=Exophiala sideris TaxID=1016849 RepID=A0ABR0JEM1_9EURO|nr:hypothetical protein LTR10_017153 [Elasticomyces elasticus]KAK5032550.1 hypothetical protein LTS07_003959 [Exophiala sideris]KAK5037271.1 hypothetical protein LTR13_005077 [Exophiala sideris]KAK5062075.1 hypothetical protein LTR69_004432 [Exophiala sideris]KAK5182429.1 hypothetical protein LTR44_005441 [Eurotiomycetes sp. CCFEE 6388]
MRTTISTVALTALLANLATAAPAYSAHTDRIPQTPKDDYYISLGPRPYYIIQNMTESPLKQKLESCENGPFGITTWSIGHRGGGTLMIPEESVESTMAGARMGAGILECDVAFTSDLGLVCRHSVCDLHTTTDILLRPELAKKCHTPFTPANATNAANALCCTSDITKAEFMSLCAKMDGSNSTAKTPQDYQHGVPFFRTELYDTCAQPMSLDSYITLVDSLPGYRNFTPELKTPPAQVPMPFKGSYTQAQYARDLIQTFINHGIDPSRVWTQSFTPADVYLWLNEYPAFGKQAVFLDQDGDVASNWTTAVNRLPALKASGVNIISPPINYLLAVAADNKTIVPSDYAITAKKAGLDIIAWSFERSGPLTRVKADNDYYYTSVANAVHYDGQLYEVLDIMGRQIGIKGMFADWSATVTYYANCMGLKGPGNN